MLSKVSDEVSNAFDMASKASDEVSNAFDMASKASDEVSNAFDMASKASDRVSNAFDTIFLSKNPIDFKKDILYLCETEFKNDLIMRKTYIKVKDFALTALNKAEFIGFLSRVITILKELKEGSSSGSEPDLPEVQSETDGVASLYIDQALIDELQACLDELQDRTRNSRSTLATKTLEQIDKERDALVSYILTVLAQSLDLSLADQREAGTILYNDLKVYAGATGLPQTQETVTINGMIGDAESEKLAPHVETMGLTPHFEELKRLNNLYEKQSRERDDETAPAEVSTKELRQQATALYQEIVDRANGANLLHESEDTLAFMKAINRLIEKTEADYNRRKAQGGKGDDEDETPTDTPADDEKPSEDETPTVDETPDEGETPDETPDEGETPGEGTEEPDDRPVVQ